MKLLHAFLFWSDCQSPLEACDFCLATLCFYQGSNQALHQPKYKRKCVVFFSLLDLLSFNDLNKILTSRCISSLP